MTRNETAYQHTQRATLCWLLYAVAVTFLLLGGVLRAVPPIFWTLSLGALLMLVVAASFHRLTVTDRGESLSIAFGPIPLFRRNVKYRDVVSVETGRTTILDGWGIHLSLNGGWVWNIWGRDCVVVRLKNGGLLRIGSDDAANLARFLTKLLRGETVNDTIRCDQSSFTSVQRFIPLSIGHDCDWHLTGDDNMAKVLTTDEYFRLEGMLLANMKGQAAALAGIAPEGRAFCNCFAEILVADTGREFTMEDNQHWIERTAPIVQAFLHAKYFLEMAVKYAGQFDEPPETMPSGWAAMLCLYALR